MGMSERLLFQADLALNGCGGATRPVAASRLARSLTREQLFAGLFLLAFVNGTLIRVLLLAGEDGWGSATANTFGISVLIWAALWLGTRFLLQAPQTPVQSKDTGAA